MKKRLAIIFCAVVLVSLLGGCAKANNPGQGASKAGTTVSGKAPLDPVYKEYISGEKTSYFVPAENGEHTYLKKNHPLVQEVAAAVEGFCRDASNRDYRTDDGKKEYKWYTKEIVEQLTEKKDAEKTLAEYKKYELVQKEVGTTVVGVMFSNSGKAAQAAFEEKIRWENATQAFLSQNQAALNKDYTMQGAAVLKIEDGQWRIQGVRFNKPQSGK